MADRIAVCGGCGMDVVLGHERGVIQVGQLTLNVCAECAKVAEIGPTSISKTAIIGHYKAWTEADRQWMGRQC